MLMLQSGWVIFEISTMIFTAMCPKNDLKLMYAKLHINNNNLIQCIPQLCITLDLNFPHM